MKRILLAVILTVVGWVSVTNSLAYVLNKSDPSAAYKLAPQDGRIVGNLAQLQMSIAPASGRQSQSARLARRAVRLDATSVDGLEVLGLQAQLRGRTELAKRIFAHSLSLSRRELRPHLWAIEEAVSRGDIVAALRQYDLAFRTSRQASEILFPVLASAIEEAEVRSALLHLLQSDPPWAGGFLSYVGRGLVAPVSAATFFRECDANGIPIKDSSRTSLVNALVRQGDVGTAWDLYTSFRQVKRSLSRDPNFISSIQDPAVFDWNVMIARGLSATMQNGKSGGSVGFSAAPSAGGEVLRQQQFLPPGVYQFEGIVEDLEQPDSSRPYWVLKCDGDFELGRIPVPNAIREQVGFSGRFTVPNHCVTQTLSLILRPSREITGVSGRISLARLLPAVEQSRRE